MSPFFFPWQPLKRKGSKRQKVDADTLADIFTENKRVYGRMEYSTR